MSHYKKEWKEKASIDYFPHFLALWVGFNSWYNDHYKNYNLSTDRAHIEKIKSEFIAPTNEIYDNFSMLINSHDNKSIAFKSYIESLYYALDQNQTLFYRNTKKLLSFHNLKYGGKYDDVVYGRQNFHDLQNNDESYLNFNFFEFDNVIFKCEQQELFAGILEIIYQVRCSLVHGIIDPNNNNYHDIVKYCYYILYALMQE